MEDFAVLGTVMARAVGQEVVWETGLNGVKTRQAELLLEDDVLLQGIEIWLSNNPTTLSSPLDTRQLYNAAKTALYGADRPDASWPRSVKSFGRHLVGAREEIKEHLAKSGIQMTWRESRKHTYYEFDPLI
jgi:hypothetical protein